MNRYSVIITEEVRSQMSDQIFFIARHSIDNALAWGDRIEAAMYAIGNTPNGFPVHMNVSERAGRVTRKMVFEKNYLVFYFHDEENLTIQIVSLRHTAKLPRQGGP